ncbi:MAG: hypothetical protein E6H86_11650 [Chloroflexi bacterium]|nr:MAG: hypothetical protein E6H86_11650 [Chloroflexota bacterium]
MLRSSCRCDHPTEVPRPHPALRADLPGKRGGEGGWQVIRAGDEFQFVPPERLQMIFARGPDVTLAA